MQNNLKEQSWFSKSDHIIYFNTIFRAHVCLSFILAVIVLQASNISVVLVLLPDVHLCHMASAMQQLDFHPQLVMGFGRTAYELPNCFATNLSLLNQVTWTSYHFCFPLFLHLLLSFLVLCFVWVCTGQWYVVNRPHDWIHCWCLFGVRRVRYRFTKKSCGWFAKHYTNGVSVHLRMDWNCLESHHFLAKSRNCTSFVVFVSYSSQLVTFCLILVCKPLVNWWIITSPFFVQLWMFHLIFIRFSLSTAALRHDFVYRGTGRNPRRVRSWMLCEQTEFPWLMKGLFLDPRRFLLIQIIDLPCPSWGFYL